MNQANTSVKILFIGLCLLVGFGLSACSGGGGGGGGGGVGVLPATSNAVYLADQDTAGVNELYQVDSATPGVTTKLNSALVAGGNVTSQVTSPDGTKVAYVADQDTDEVFEVYLVDLTTPGVSTKLNSALVADGDVFDDIAFTPDSTQIIYRADQDTDNMDELYLVDLATPGVSTKLNSTLVAAGKVNSFVVSPDGTRVVYRGERDILGEHEIYFVDLATPGVATQLNSALPVNGDVVDGFFAFTPDSTRMVYIADQDVNNIEELYLVALATPGVSMKLNSALVAMGVVNSFAISPDGTRVVYRGERDLIGEHELYLVDLATPGVDIELNSILPLNGDVVEDSYSFSSDSARVVYIADQDVNNIEELYFVDIATPGVTTKINSALVAGGIVTSQIMSPDNSMVAYVADQDSDEVFELYLVDLATPGVSTKLNSALVADGDVFDDIAFSLDGSEVAYAADQDTDTVIEVYLVDISVPGTSIKLNSPVMTGVVSPSFEFLP